MAALSDGQIRQIEQQLNARPEIVQALSANAAGSRGLGGRLGYDPRLGDQRAQASDVYHRFGISFPDAEDYNIVRDQKSGQLRLDHHGYWSRNVDWLVPVITFAGAAAGGALAGGGASNTPEISLTGSSSSLGPAAPTTAAGITGGTASGGVTAGGVAAGTGTGASIWNAVRNGADAANGGNGNRGNALGALGALIPLLIRRSQSSGGDNGAGKDGMFGGDVGKEMAGLLNLQGQRLKDMMPVRQAALRLAMSMAPSAATTPRLNEAAQNASLPRPTTAQDPQVMAALQRLMGGG